MSIFNLEEVVVNKVYRIVKGSNVLCTIKRDIEFKNVWVARNNEGKVIDYDKYRHDLFERIIDAAN